MRITVHIDPALLAAAKKLAVDTVRTLAEVIEDALREVIARRANPRRRRRIRLPVHGKGGPRPGVDLNGCAALVDFMESPGKGHST